MGITDLEEQFTFYASYHHNTLNKLIHIVCVWPLLWSAFVLLQYVHFELDISFLSTVTNIHPINLTFAIASYYAGVYILMDKNAGTLASALVFACLFTGRKFYLESDESLGYPAWQVATVIQIFAWGFQFVGHGAFEGRAPALLDNFMQATVMGPFFVFLEVMFFFGYRPEIQQNMWENVRREVAKLNTADRKKL